MKSFENIKSFKNKKPCKLCKKQFQEGKPQLKRIKPFHWYKGCDTFLQWYKNKMKMYIFCKTNFSLLYIANKQINMFQLQLFINFMFFWSKNFFLLSSNSFISSNQNVGEKNEKIYSKTFEVSNSTESFLLSGIKQKFTELTDFSRKKILEIPTKFFLTAGKNIFCLSHNRASTLKYRLNISPKKINRILGKYTNIYSWLHRKKVV